MLKKISSGFAALTITLLPALAMAADGSSSLSDKAFVGLAAALTIAIAVFGGALGQGKAAAAALEGIARNPGAADKLFVPMLLGLALIESLVIYALIIAFNLTGKMG
jgi:F-type H+-transporting ATPase subunit c